MDGYDLDGTLAAVDYASGRPRVELFATAPVIYTPDAPFVVITSRRLTTGAEHDATVKWLMEHERHYLGLHVVAGRTAEQIAAGKAAVIRRLELTDYTDNNPAVLALLARAALGVRLWVMSAAGERRRFVDLDTAALARRWAPTL